LIARVTIFASIGWSSGTRIVTMTRSTNAALKRRISSSPSDR
jgi:hypothetical protein